MGPFGGLVQSAVMAEEAAAAVTADDRVNTDGRAGGDVAMAELQDEVTTR